MLSSSESDSSGFPGDGLGGGGFNPPPSPPLGNPSTSSSSPSSGAERDSHLEGASCRDPTESGWLIRADWVIGVSDPNERSTRPVPPHVEDLGSDMEEDSFHSTRSTLQELTELDSLEICQRFNELSTMDEGAPLWQTQGCHKELRRQARPRGLTDRPVQLGADYLIDTTSFLCKVTRITRGQLSN